MAVHVYPNGVADIIQVRWTTYRKMLQNLGWAVGYTFITVVRV